MPPQSVTGNVMDLSMRGRGLVVDDLEAYYASAFPQLVGYLTPIVGGRSDAEDLAQEAFIRLVMRWQKIQAYEDPDAWLRSVAFRLAVSRWRRLRTAARHLAGQSSIPVVNGPNEDAVLVDAVLKPLSLEHRQVLVLHHALGFSVDDIARELGVPAGTVKSRLSRARAAAVQEGGSDE